MINGIELTATTQEFTDLVMDIAGSSPEDPAKWKEDPKKIADFFRTHSVEN